MHCLLILPLICSYMWDLTSKTHIWCISDFILKIEYYNLPCHPVEETGVVGTSVLEGVALW